MTEATAEPVDTTKVDAAFAAVNDACAQRGIVVARLTNPAPNCLGVELTGVTRTWPVYVDCGEEHLRLPRVWTKPPTSPLAHVSYSGSVCIDDGQGLSLDPERSADIVVHAILKDSFFDRVPGRPVAVASVLVVAGALAVAGLALLERRGRLPRPGPLVATAGAVVAVVLALAVVHPHYMDRRYHEKALWRWSRDLHDQRIGVHGGLAQAKYPLAGLDLSNRVDYIGVSEDGVGNRAPVTCDEWLAELRRMRFDYVVLSSLDGGPAGPVTWTAAMEDAPVVLRERVQATIELGGGRSIPISGEAIVHRIDDVDSLRCATP